jgi:hypothetical protein
LLKARLIFSRLAISRSTLFTLPEPEDFESARATSVPNGELPAVEDLVSPGLRFSNGVKGTPVSSIFADMFMSMPPKAANRRQLELLGNLSFHVKQQNA